MQTWKEIIKIETQQRGLWIEVEENQSLEQEDGRSYVIQKIDRYLVQKLAY